MTNMKISLKVWTYEYEPHLKVWTARGEDYFVGLESLPLRCQGTIDQRTALEECVEILY